MSNDIDMESESDSDSLWDEFDEAMAYMTLIDQGQNDAIEGLQRLQLLLEDTIFVEDRDLEDVLLELHDTAMKEIEKTGETSFLSAIKQLNFTSST
jgi:hypothetical protein